MESFEKLMEEIQTDEGDFFEADKFACNQEVFDLMRKLPNFKSTDPTVPESGYFYGKPIYVHPACAPNTIMGFKNQKKSQYLRLLICAQRAQSIFMQTLKPLLAFMEIRLMGLRIIERPECATNRMRIRL